MVEPKTQEPLQKWDPRPRTLIERRTQDLRYETLKMGTKTQDLEHFIGGT